MNASAFPSLNIEIINVGCKTYSNNHFDILRGISIISLFKSDKMVNG
jgi:hypothetical protein